MQRSRTTSRRTAHWRAAILGGIAVLTVAAIGCGSKAGTGTATTPVTTPTAAAAAKTAQPAASPPPAAGYANPDKLVSTDWLVSKAADPSVVVIDLRKKEAYDAGHIAGAAWSNTAEWNVMDKAGVNQLAPAEKIADILGKAGVKPESTIVLYDDQAGLAASRALWSVEVYGHKDARLLNGGWTAWAAQGKPSVKEAPQRAATQYVFSAKPNDQIIASFDEMVKAVGDSSKVVLDVRTPEEFAGRDVRAKLGGRIPGSLNVPYTEAVNKSGEFLPISDLRKLYETAGLKSSDSRTIYTYCQSGVRAAHSWFVLKYLIGDKNVEMYDGSWEEWGNRTDTKIETTRS